MLRRTRIKPSVTARSIFGWLASTSSGDGGRERVAFIACDREAVHDGLNVYVLILIKVSLNTYVILRGHLGCYSVK